MRVEVINVDVGMFGLWVLEESKGKEERKDRGVTQL